jgi:hypothetical protein
MRNLIRNNRQMWYAVYTKEDPETDENGDFTGDDSFSYGAPVEFRANLSATRGTQGFTGTGASDDYFGADVDYSLIISTADMTLPIDENTLIWTSQPVVVGKVVDYSSAQYVVTAVARGLYHMKYAIKQRAKG